MAVDKLLRTRRYVQRLYQILRRAHVAYFILRGYEDFNDGRDGYPIGKDSRDTQMMLLAHREVFASLNDALYLDIHIQLAKLLLPYRGSLNIESSIKYADTHGREILKMQDTDWFRSEIESFALWVSAIPPCDIARKDDLYRQSRRLIDKLKVARDNNLAHETKSESSHDLLTLDEIEKLIEMAKESIHIIERGYSGHDYDGYRLEWARSDTARILTSLLDNY